MRRHGFELRLALTFLLALAAVIAVQYVLAGRLAAGFACMELAAVSLPLQHPAEASPIQPVRSTCGNRALANP